MLKNYVGAHLRLVNHWKGKKKRELYIYTFFFFDEIQECAKYQHHRFIPAP